MYIFVLPIYQIHIANDVDDDHNVHNNIIFILHIGHVITIVIQYAGGYKNFDIKFKNHRLPQSC